ncbi:MAG: ABC transporter permease [Chloroflexi bacterium]|nr:ABC transporter permease [Chloroflexota bacterium]MYA94582.1 ABC transporter permease [Chloroflexota bacterium]MYD39160.1 ABC transporter permease [Chloroflexota bacterium]MYE79821.1 ABC transporter permease [Chloroflexota bacterium]MYH64614.1 ABC transporter permease [Chloroflexota bacterium]
MPSKLRRGIASLRLELLQSYGFMARNWHLTKRYWGWEVVWFFYSLTSGLSVVFIAQGAEALTGTAPGFDVQYLTMYLIIGTLVWRYLSNIFMLTSEVIAWERWEGTIEYTLMAPVRRWVHLVGQTGYSLIYSLITTLAIGIAMALFFELDLSGANLLGAGAVILAGSLSLIAIGIVASILPLLYPERGAQMTSVVEASFLLISGVYYPITVLPDWMQAIAVVSPVTFVLEGTRAAVLEGAGLSELWAYILPLLVIGVVALPIGLRLFRAAEQFAKRTGRLKRVG